MMDSWASGSITISGSQTASYMVYGVAEAPRCHHDGHHTIRRLHAKGSNGTVRRETGECIHCGKEYTRTIRWDTKDARGWWEPIEEVA